MSVLRKDTDFGRTDKFLNYSYLDEIINIFTDGASRGNPGLSAAGIVIKDERNNILGVARKFLGEHTNNYAEYMALIESIYVLESSGIKAGKINFFLDSELVVKQIKGEYKIRNKDLIRLSLDFMRKIAAMKIPFEINYIPRKDNEIADKLANEAIDSYLSGKEEKV